MNIIMNYSRRGSPDGFNVYYYGKGIVYFDVPRSLASAFIREGAARLATLQDIDEQFERVREAFEEGEEADRVAKAKEGAV